MVGETLRNIGSTVARPLNEIRCRCGQTPRARTQHIYTHALDKRLVDKRPVPADRRRNNPVMERATAGTSGGSADHASKATNATAPGVTY